MADNTLIIKQKSTLPVSKTRQDKSLFRSLSDTYLPPANPTRCASHRQREHRAFVRAKARFAGQKAQEHSFVRRNAVFTGHICHVSLAAFSGGKCRACLNNSRRPSVRPTRSHSLPVERLLPGLMQRPPLPGVSRFRRIGSHLRRVTQASGPALWQRAPGNRQPPAMLLC